MRAESMKCGRSGVLFDADAAPVLAHPFVVDVARDGREQGVVAAYADAASDRDDLEGGQVGTTSVVHPHTLLGLVADALDARPAAVHDHPGVDFDAVSLRSDLRLLAVAEQQHATDLHRRSRFGREAVDQDAVPGRHAVLLSAADDDGRRRTIRLGHGERLYQGAGAACLRAPSPCYTRLPDSLIASARGWT